MPASRVKNKLSSLVGFSVDASASVGPVLFLNVTHLSVGAGARIGPFSVVRDMRLVHLGVNARLGQWNWISSAPAFWQADASGQLHIQEGASVTSRHYLDCSGGISIGEFATVAGVRSTFISHGIDLSKNIQRCAPIAVGAFSIVGSNTKVVPGAHVPHHSLVAMGAVVAAGLEQAYGLYAGSPARLRKNLDQDSAYFTRTTARVSVSDGTVPPA